MSSSSSNNNNNESELKGPVVVRYHAILRHPERYITRLQMFEELEYIQFTALQTPLSIEAVRYYETNPRLPILMVTPDGTIGLKKDRTPTLYNSSFRHNLLPIKIESRLLRGVPLQQRSIFGKITSVNATLN
jgi:hypothetical protein